RIGAPEAARRATQGAVLIRPCPPGRPLCQSGHGAVPRQKMRINPASFPFEPDIKKTLNTPAGGRRLRHLLGRILFEKFARRDQRQFIFRHRQNQVLKKNWSFKPPMPEEFGIERHCHDWIPIISLQTLKFGDASLDKMMGMPAGRSFRDGTIISLFRNTAAGDAMVFYSRKVVSG